MRIQTKHAYHRTCMRILQFIVQQQDGPIHVPDVAEFAGFSRFHLSRFFQTFLNEPLSELLRRIRLERSAYYLLTTDRLITEIAKDAGYSGIESYDRAFSDEYQVSPRDFRCSDLPRDWRLPSPSNVHWDPSGTAKGYDTDPIRDFELSIIALPKLRLAAARYLGAYCDIHLVWPYLYRMRDWSGIVTHETKFMALYHDDFETAPNKYSMRCDLCISLEEDVPVPNGMRLIELPASVYVTTKKALDIQELSQCWPLMSRAWVPRQGRRPKVVPSFEWHDTWPIPWETARTRLLMGLELDSGDPGDIDSVLPVPSGLDYFPRRGHHPRTLHRAAGC